MRWHHHGSLGLALYWATNFQSLRGGVKFLSEDKKSVVVLINKNILLSAVYHSNHPNES